ncbi:dynein regulatory complex protein 11-like [Hetaerina americana]|uniref:dynein regulatory complex protein 11-like n=1 Tax=Hetaerina americana TaxID=62018 RepID=UPI003A7F334B
MTFTRAILIIQKHERVRQAQKKYDNFHRLMKLRQMGKYPSLAQDDGSILTRAAIIIQKTWRGYKCRKSYLKRKIEEMVIMGMVPPLEYNTHTHKANHEMRVDRHQIQRQRAARFLQVIPGDKPRQILRKRRRMLTKLRNRDRDWYYRNVLFRRRPSFTEFNEEHPPANGRIEKKLGEKRFIPRKSKVPPVPKKKKKKGEKVENSPEKKKQENEGPLERPVLRKQLIWEAQEYKKLWQSRDESCNFLQLHNMDPIRKRNFKELKRDVRKIMNELMLLELQRLQAAIKEYHLKRKKGKKNGKKKGGKKKKKKGKKGGKKKKRGQVDLTGDRTFESLFEELVANGVIRRYPETNLFSFTGELSLCGQDVESLGKPVDASLGDVRKLIKEYCIIPLGSEFVHMHAPFVKSLLIAGPHETGKHLILNAICTELDAFLFDITNENIAEKYPDKESLKMLVHLVTKMSRILQPSIIFYDNAEKAFIKKVPKSDTSNPRRLGKILPKITKGIKPIDRVMLIGISERPFDAKQKGLNKTFQKFIYVPRPKYATLCQHWNDILYDYGRLNNGFDYHTMAKISDGYNLASISRVIGNHLTCMRLLTVGFKKLHHDEFFMNLSEEVAVYNEGEAKFLNWLAKCPLGKKKHKYLKAIEELNVQKDKKK